MDITERKRAEHALRENEALLSAVLKKVPLGLGVMDTAGKWIVTNAIMDEFVPRAIPSTLPDRINRWRAWDSGGKEVPPEDWPGKRALRGEIVSPGLNMLFTGDDGREQWMRVSAAPLRDADKIIGAIAVVQDIDQIKRAQDALREAQNRLELALEGSGAVVWGWNAVENRLDDWTPQHRRLYGFRPDESPRLETWFARIHPDDRERLRARAERVLKTPGDDIWNEEFRIFHPEGANVGLADWGAFRDESGRMLRMAGVNSDITERKQAEAALRTQAAELQRSR